MQTKAQLEHKIEVCTKLYDLIEAYINDFGYAPSLREMGAMMNINSTSMVRGYVSTLEAWGWAKVDSGKSRALKLLPKTKVSVQTRHVRVSRRVIVASKHQPVVRPDDHKTRIRQQIRPFGKGGE